MGIIETTFSDSGEMSVGEGEGMASLKDAVQQANALLITVSRVINEPERLRPETYKKVIEAVDALGYVPDLSAKKIRNAKITTNTTGVLMPDTMTTPFSVEITLLIGETTWAHGWNSFAVNMLNDDKPEKMVDLLLVHRLDGTIYTTTGLRQVPVPEKLHKYRYALADYESTNDPFPTYVPDDEQG